MSRQMFHSEWNKKAAEKDQRYRNLFQQLFCQYFLISPHPIIAPALPEGWVL